MSEPASSVPHVMLPAVSVSISVQEMNWSKVMLPVSILMPPLKVEVPD